MDEIMEDIPKLEGYNCFACGTANPIGLNLRFYRRGGYVCSDITLEKNYEGWENMAHGGIVSTLLDEVMSWAVIYFRRTFFVTRSMRIKYVRPVPLYRLLTVKGTMIEGQNRYLCKARGLIQDEDKNILARAEASFAILSDKDLYLVPDNLKREMDNLFKRF
ncbi:MAG: PaaI family thioesterase [Deltaproteobacteria bacterium]|nr:MAG: PaaI family thioesterase [Deltaproteobacteria bacterium]